VEALSISRKKHCESIHDIDEAQNLTPLEAKRSSTRGSGKKIIFTGDPLD